jgi:ankyrin repeat protein
LRRDRTAIFLSSLSATVPPTTSLPDALRMAELASIASSAPDQRHLRLIAASAQANESRVRDVLSEETSWTSHNDRDALRQSLQKVAARGNLSVALLLLKYGAEVNVRSRKDGKDGGDKEMPALFKAAENGSVGLVKVLLEHGADVEWRSPKTGMAALWPACQRGHVGVVRLLLDRGARVDTRDREGRTILLWLAGEKVEEKKDSKPEPSEEEVKNMTPKERAIREKGIRDAAAKERVAEEKAKARLECIRLLVGAGANMEARDSIDRTPLLWAATMGNLALMDALLSGELGKKANIHAANKKGRNALHLAAESNHEKMVELLLRRGANPNAVSDGRWTALHNACQAGHVGVVKLLLAYGANVNAQLSNEVTALHWACLNGHTQVVELLLERPETNPYVKDSFDMTPMLCAAERHHKDIVKMLSPARLANRLSDAAKAACKAFEATVVDFGSFRDGKKQLVFKHSVWELLYGWDEKEDKPTVATLPRNIKYQPAIRWIHLPANNVNICVPV